MGHHSLEAARFMDVHSSEPKTLGVSGCQGYMQVGLVYGAEAWTWGRCGRQIKLVFSGHSDPFARGINLTS